MTHTPTILYWRVCVIFLFFYHYPTDLFSIIISHNAKCADPIKFLSHL